MCDDGSVHCAGHCPGPRSGANRARGAAERRVQPRARSRSPPRDSARQVADRQAEETAQRLRRQGITTSRSTIELRLLGQWRIYGNNLGARPMPTAGQHATIVPGSTWAEALPSRQTRELLSSEAWIHEKCHDSVHLTLFLRWAEDQKAQQASRRQGAFELGNEIARRILSFTGDL